MNTLILVPGLLCDKAVWQHQIVLLEKNYRILVPNLNNASTPNTMVKAVLDIAPETFALAGHSMGGWVALELMRHHADRVTKLCLANTSAALDPPGKSEARKEMIHLIEQGQEDDVINMLLKGFIYNEAIKDDVIAMLKRNIGAFINQEKAMMIRDDCLPILNNIHCPTTIIHANQDKVFNLDDAKTLKQGISHATLHKIDHCGHMSPMEAAQQVTDTMSGWLSQ